jgi:hypothetical protein
VITKPAFEVLPLEVFLRLLILGSNSDTPDGNEQQLT